MSDYSKSVRAVVLNNGQEVPDVIGHDPDPSAPGGIRYVGYARNGRRVTFTADEIASVMDADWVLQTAWVDECMNKQR